MCRSFDSLRSLRMTGERHGDAAMPFSINHVRRSFVFDILLASSCREAAQSWSRLTPEIWGASRACLRSIVWPPLPRGPDNAAWQELSAVGSQLGVKDGVDVPSERGPVHMREA